MEIIIWQVEKDQENTRLDVACTAYCSDMSRAYIAKLIKNGCVTVGGLQRKAGFKLKAGDEITMQCPDPEPYEIQAEDIPLEIVYEDEDLLVVNKPKGMVVHPAPGNYSGTMVNALMHHTKDLSGINGVLRPGIIHRIDKDTTGLLLVAKNDMAHLKLSEQLKEHTIVRQYRGLAKGNVKTDEGKIDMPIGRHPKDRIRMAVVKAGGKTAVTHYHVTDRYRKGYTLLTFRLETGRTHQIRVHMQAIGHPLAGDLLYNGDKGNPFKTEGQCLHAEKIGFIHPRTGEYMEFNAPLPDYFKKILSGLGDI